MRAIASPRSGEIAPELNTLRVLKSGDLHRERIEVVLVLGANQLVSRCFQNAAEGEKEAEIETLFVAFDSGKRGHADVGARGDFVQRKIPTRSGLTNSCSQQDGDFSLHLQCLQK